MNFNISFGCLSDSLYDQFIEQGFNVDLKNISTLDADKSKIEDLYVRGYLTEKQVDALYKKLANKIKKELK